MYFAQYEISSRHGLYLPQYFASVIGPSLTRYNKTRLLLETNTVKFR